MLRRIVAAAVLCPLVVAPAAPPNQAGPNAPAGLVTVWPGYDGSILPAASLRGDARNRFGSNSFGVQAAALSIVDDPGNPTGSGRALRIPFPGATNPDWPTVFKPDDFGGQAPARFALQSDLDSAGRTWRELYVRIAYRVSPNFTQHGVKASREVITEGTATGGSLTTTIDSTARWRKDEHAGRYVQWGQTVRRIASNSAHELVLASGEWAYNPRGNKYRIVTVGTGAPGWNVGTKLFFPRLSCTMVDSQGQKRTARPGDNNFVAMWMHFDGPVEGLTPTLGIQINQVWDGTSRTATGLPEWDRKGLFGNFPRVHQPTATPAGTWVDAEYYFKVGTPGGADGIYTVWINGERVHHVTGIPYAPKWAPKKTDRGLEAEECVDPRWSFVWMDPTFGGGLNIPQKDQDVLIRGWYIGGK